MSTELPSRAPAAALNSASRRSSTARVAAAARMTCSPSRALSVVRSVAAGVVEVTGVVEVAAAVMHPAPSTAMAATAQTDFTTIALSMFAVLLGLGLVDADLAAHRGMPLAEVRVHTGLAELDGRGCALSLEPLAEVAITRVWCAGRHRVRDVVLVGPRDLRAGLDREAARAKLEHPDLDLRR